ncbi:MAG: hypothetical protein K9K37_07065 [Desulfocapsa sp.]|nr:hypothetical protein [Desulfocapsa sp.]
MKIVLVTGPSGAGKDTLLRIAREYFRADKQVCFSRRYITRIPDENEGNYFIGQDAFTLLRDNNFFVSHWQAHGNCYGIARTELSTLPRGSVSIVSISRGSIADFENSFEEVITLCLTVRKDILRKRLQARGREDERAIEQRL